MGDNTARDLVSGLKVGDSFVLGTGLVHLTKHMPDMRASLIEWRCLEVDHSEEYPVKLGAYLLGIFLGAYKMKVGASEKIVITPETNEDDEDMEGND